VTKCIMVYFKNTVHPVLFEVVALMTLGSNSNVLF